jgi:hypothetical protein
MDRVSLRQAIAFFLMASMALTQQVIGAAQQAAAGLKIVVIEGEDGVNIIQKNTAVKPIVEVRDKNDLPVAGAIVTFALVETSGGSAATALFESGQQFFSVVTDKSGRAVAEALRPLARGAFRIQVQASYQGQIATATINQTNFMTAAEAMEAGKNPDAQQSNSQQSQQASNTANGSNAANAASSAGAASGGGMSTMTMVGLGAAGIGGAAAVTKMVAKDCSQYEDPLFSAVNNTNAVCGSFNSTFNQCRNAAQQGLNILNDYCACEGPSGDPELQSYAAQFEPLYRQLGLTFPSACR